MITATNTTNPLAVFVAAIGKIGGYKAVERQLDELRRHIASMTPEARHNIMRIASPVLGAPVSTDEIRELLVSSPEQGFFELERLGAAPEGAADVGRIVTDAIRDERLAPETRATLLWRYNHMAEYRDSALAGAKGVIPFGLLDSEEDANSSATSESRDVKLSGEQWAHLLGRQPQFADKCDWAKLSGEQLFQLLEHLRYAAKRYR